MKNQIEQRDNGIKGRVERRSDDNNWIVGIALIVIGGLFMLENFNILDISMINWWAIFILIPGLSMTVNSWRLYQETQTKGSLNSGIRGLALILIAFALFFNISWSLILPLFLIGAGVYLISFPARKI